MHRSSRLTSMFLMAAVQAVLVACVTGAAERSDKQVPSVGLARLEGGALTIEARQEKEGVVISLRDSRGIE
jgi:hypothetical protein